MDGLMDEKQILFEQKPVPRAVIQLALPTVLSSLVMVLYNLADTYFVGMLDDPIQNAAVTLAAPVMLAFSAVTNLFGAGSSSVMSRAMGRHAYETARRTSAFGLYCALACGLLFSIACLLFQRPLLALLGADDTTIGATLSYMRWTVFYGAAPSIFNVVAAYLVRAEGETLHASIGTMSGCVLNMVLDPIFVLPWGFGLGAAGAGFATFFSNCVASLYFVLFIYRKRGHTLVCLTPKKVVLHSLIVRSIFQVGVPAAIQNLLNVTGMTILNNLVSGYGANAIAAMGICSKINTFPVDMALGFTEGVLPLISYNYASRNFPRMKETILFSGKLLTAVMCVIAAVLFLFPGVFVSLFMENQEVVAYGSRILRGYALALPFLRMDFFTVGIFQSVGMGRETFFFAVARKLLLEIPAMFLLNTLFPLYGLAYAQLTAEVIMAAISLVMLRRLFRQLNSKFQGVG